MARPRKAKRGKTGKDRRRKPPPASSVSGPRRGRLARSIAASVIFILALGGGLAAWSFLSHPPNNVVLVIIDTLRQDALGCYGNPHRATPRMDAIAAEGVRFDQAISTSGWTLPAVGSLLTGAWPRIHGGMGKNTSLTVIRDEVPTAAEVLQGAGFNTLGFANAAFVSPMLHLDRGFDVFDHRYAYNWHIRRADETIDTAIKALREHQDESNFLMIHIFDPHLDYDPPEGYAAKHTAGRHDPPPPLTMDACKALGTNNGADPPSTEDIDYVKGVYLGEVEFVDTQIGRLVDELKRLDLYDNTTLIVTADHGEEFWDHGGFEHGHTLYDELIRIPLILKLPAAIGPVKRVVDAQVRIVDIMPTVFGLLDVEQPPSFIGESLMPLIMGEDSLDRACFSESTLYGGKASSWRSGRYKYIYTIAPPSVRGAGATGGSTVSEELYDWRNDPGEQTDLIESHPEIAAELREQLRSQLNNLNRQASTMSKPKAADMSPRNIARLRSLGYIR